MPLKSAPGVLFPLAPLTGFKSLWDSDLVALFSVLDNLFAPRGDILEAAAQAGCRISGPESDVNT